MHDYLRIFNFLWRVKRVEHSLSTIKKQHMTRDVGRLYRESSVKGSLMKCHILHYEMNHFLSNFFNYLMVEVIESAWDDFNEKLSQV